MNRYVCIHGHFYQPPRENPWLNEVELQDSAFPYHDWNERITDECYAPNASARILDEKERIVRIVNNYSRISYNFGPTLLSWLESHDRETYAAILDADRESQSEFDGHGSAIAQVYNHMIAPLANARDRKTQVVWGARDFEARFRRKAEGMWLAETAADLESLEALASEGIVFTILSPYQAARTRRIGDSQWDDASGGRVDPSMPYLARLPSGRSISIYFYDGPISRAVAFERLLSSGDHFAHRLMSGFVGTRDRPQLSHIATDGETYGHHHRNGEMALAYALDFIEKNQTARLTNYGEFLDIHPPTHEVEIFECSSWSCAHGIERWRSDCGCRTGGDPHWNQGWRRPLREALDWLRDELAPHFEREASALLSDPWAARDAYIDVILDRSDETLNEFFRKHVLRELEPDEVIRVLKLMEMQRHAMLMYTSCGWFFNDLAGIETIQVLQYAGRAIQLAASVFETPIEERFLDRLSQARSNAAAFGNGREIYERSVKPAMVDLSRVGAHYGVSLLFDFLPIRTVVYGYEIRRHDFHELEVGRAKAAVGHMSVTSEVTRESEELTFAVLYLGDVHLTGGIRAFRGSEAYTALKDELLHMVNSTDFPEVMRVLDRHLSTLTFSIKSLFRDQQRKIIASICDSTLAEAEAAFRQLHDRYVPLMRFHTELGIPLPHVLSTAAAFDLNVRLRRACAHDPVPFSQIRSLLKQAKSENVTLDLPPLSYALSRTLDTIVERFIERPEKIEILCQLEETINFVRTQTIHVDLWKAQNAYYKLLRTVGPDVGLLGNVEDEQMNVWFDHFHALGEKLSIRHDQGEDRTNK